MSLMIMLAGASSGGGSPAPGASTSMMMWGCGNVLAAIALGTAMILAAL